MKFLSFNQNTFQTHSAKLTSYYTCRSSTNFEDSIYGIACDPDSKKVAVQLVDGTVLKYNAGEYSLKKPDITKILTCFPKRFFASLYQSTGSCCCHPDVGTGIEVTL